MKISELQNILEHYKQENGDLEVRLVIDTHNGEEYNEIVLVRDKDTDTWEADIYLGYNEEDKYYHYKCTRRNYQFCIPYEGNEYILGTTNYSA